MLVVPNQSYVAWQACATITHVAAILACAFRISHKYRNRQLWADDYVVVVPLAADAIYCISPWALPSLFPDVRDRQSSHLSKLWASLLIIYTIIWLSRISFMLSLARIFPSGNLNRRHILCIALLFSITYCVCIMLLAFHCDPSKDHSRHCVHFLAGDPATTYSDIMLVIGDFLMVIGPLAVLWKVKLSKRDKQVILAAALSGNAITLLLSAARTVFTYGPFDRNSVAYLTITSMLLNLVAGTSLVSCNGLVVVTAAYRAHRRRVDEDLSPTNAATLTNVIGATSRTSQARIPGPSLHLTTINSNWTDNSQELKSHDLNLDSEAWDVDSKSERPPPSRGCNSSFVLTQISMDN